VHLCAPLTLMQALQIAYTLMWRVTLLVPPLAEINAAHSQRNRSLLLCICDDDDDDDDDDDGDDDDVDAS